MSSLADRIRSIVGTASPAAVSGVSRPTDVASGFSRTGSELEGALGGAWRGPCFVVERRHDPSASHGHSTVGTLAARLAAASAEAPLLAGAPARPPFVFLDLETTGLSGGAGTYAFLVGCGWFDEAEGFTTRQYVLVRFADERPLLAEVGRELARAGALVSFNGKSFDAPVLETRYLFHRLEWIGAGLPHIDVLHPARQFWGSGVERAFQARFEGGPERAALRQPSGCSLVALESDVLGARRVGDVPGFEIPSRYFRFVRSGDPRPLAAVLEHNRLDLLSLAGLATRLFDLVRSGPDAAEDAREALALGRIYGRAGLDGPALAAHERAVTLSGASTALIRISSLRALAICYRRARRYDDAARCWNDLLDVSECPGALARDAYEALAIHHEHRVRDFAAAKTFALRSLDREPRPAWTQAVRHRVARIERRMSLLD